MPAKAIWPSDSWPAQPVSTVSDSAQSANAEDRRVQQVPGRLGDDERQDRPRRGRGGPGRSGRSGGPTRSRAAAPGSVWPWRRRRTSGSRRGPGRLCQYTAITTAMRSRKSMRPGWSRKLKLMTACTTPMAMPATNARGNETIPAMTAAASARTRVLGPRLSRFWADPAWPAEQRQRQRGQPAGERPDGGRDHLRADAGQAGEVGVLGRGLDRLAERRAVEQPAEADGDERDDDEDRELRADDPDAGDLVRRRRSAPGTGAPGASISGYADEDRQRELGDADGGDQHDHPRRGEQPADDDQLDERAVERCRPTRPIDGREPERHVVLRRRAARRGRRRRGRGCRRRS